MGRAFDTIAVLDSLYAEALEPRGSFLARAAGVMRPLLDAGLGTLVFEFDLSQPGVSISPIEEMVGERELATRVRSSFDNASAEFRMSTYVRGPVLTLNDTLGCSLHDHPHTAQFARELGAHDFLSVQAADVEQRGVQLEAPLPRGVTIDRGQRRQWSLLASHVSAAGRLHRRVTADASLCAALELNGGSARAVQESRAIATADVALGHAAARSGPVGTPTIWSILACGSWSPLSTYAGGSGRRIMFACANPPGMRDPRALSERERAVAERAAFGDANKVIAYELGIAETTVGVLLTRVRRRLRVRSRAELVRSVRALIDTPCELRDVGGQLVAFCELPGGVRELAGVTAGERKVAELAAAGCSNREIAARRGTSASTVANQLASIYAKLGLQSRAQLTLLMRR
jgi:DNA-binding CsgD family transcriptional regulator